MGIVNVTREQLEKLLPDWGVSEFEDYFELCSHSPEGEEIDVPLEKGKTLSEMAMVLYERYNNFDPEHHAAMIYHRKHYGSKEQQEFYAGAPGSLEDLIKDARAIDNMYYEAGKALEDAGKEKK